MPTFRPLSRHQRSIPQPSILAWALALGLAWGLFPGGGVRTASAAAPISVQRIYATDYSGTTGPSDRYGSVMASGAGWLAVAAPAPISGAFFTQHTGGRVILWKKDSVTGNWLQKQILTAPGEEGSDPANGFGTTLATDGLTLLVGSSLGTTSSRVHVYRLDAEGVWQADGVLSPLGLEAAVKYGRVLAVQGSLALVGSPDAQGQDGQVEVFRREVQGWTHVTTLLHPVPGTRQRMGSALAFSGSTLYLGAPQHSASASITASGRVSVFTASGSTWVWARDLAPSIPTAGQRLGTRLEVSGTSLRVTGSTGLNEYDTSLNHQLLSNLWLTSTSGSVHVLGSMMVVHREADLRFDTYVRSTTPPIRWSLQTSGTSLPNLDGGTFHLMDREVLLGGDIIPLVGDPPPTTVSSTVRRFIRNGTSTFWTNTSSVVPAEILRMRHTTFGSRISTDQGWAVVGSPFTRPGGELTQRGLIFTYRVLPDGRHQFHSLLPAPVSPGLNEASIGSELAVFGDWIAIRGAPLATNGTSVVILYQYVAEQDAWVQRQVLSPPSVPATTVFGNRLSMSGSSLLIGAFGGNAAYLYDRSAEGVWTLTATLTPSGGSAGEAFPASLCLDSTTGRAIIGATTSILGPTNFDGAAYCYALEDGQWIQEQRLTSPTDLGYRTPYFGSSVSLTGDHALIGLGTGTAPKALAVSYRRAQAPSASDPWEHHQTLVRDPAALASEGATSCIISGANALLRSAFGLFTYTLQEGAWGSRSDFLDGTLPSLTSLRTFTLSSRHVYLATPSDCQVVDLIAPPTLTEVRAIPADIPITALVGSTVAGFYTFTLTNEGLAPVTLDLSLEGDTADFLITPAQSPQITIGQSLRITLAPLASSTFTVHFKPQSAGVKTLTVRRILDVLGATAQTFSLSATGVTPAEGTLLDFHTQPVSGFLGQTLSVHLRGTHPMTYRWVLDGKTVPGATGSQYTPTVPGLYSVDVSNVRGKLPSRQVRIGSATYPAVLDQHAIPGEKVTWTTQTHLTGMSVEWVEDPVGDPEADPDGGLFTAPYVKTSGRTSTLTLTADAARIHQGPRACTVRVHLPAPEGGTLTQERKFSLEVHPAPLVEMPFPENGCITLGQPFDRHLNCVWEGPVPAAITYQCSGLPPGLSLRFGSLITGTPTKAGLYTVSASASFGRYKTATLTRKIAVIASADLPPPGVYESLIPITDLGGLVPGSSLPLGGHITLTLQPTGSYSAKLRLGPKNLSASGTLLPAPPPTTAGILRAGPAFDLPLSPGGVQKCALVSGTGFLRLVPVLPSGAWGTELATLEFTRPQTAAQEWLPGPHLGRHAIGIQNLSTPIGAAYGTVTVGKDCLLTYALTGPDGSTLTGTCYSIPGTGARLASHSYLRDSTGSALMGRPLIPAGPDTDDVPNLTWVRAPQKSRLYPDGVLHSGLKLRTSRIDATTVKQTFASKTGSLFIQGTRGDSLVALLSWSTALKTSFNQGGPVTTTLTLSTSSGLFSGKWAASAPDPAQPWRNIIRTTAYKGILLPEHRLALGSYLLPALPDPAATPPTSASTTPIESGLVEIKAFP